MSTLVLLRTLCAWLLLGGAGTAEWDVLSVLT